MGRYLNLGMCSLATALLAGEAARGAAFSYSTNFSGTHQTVPAGWVTGSSRSQSSYHDGQIFTGDSLTSWRPALGTTFIHNPYSTTAGISGARLNLLGPQYGTGGTAMGAWYQAATGDGHTGTYPLKLQNSSLRASFDVSIRTGTNQCNTYADGTYVGADAMSFMLQPVVDTSHIQLFGFPGAGWPEGLGMPGIAVDFDVYDNGSGNGEPGGDTDRHNHVGIQAVVDWNLRTGNVASVVSNLDPPYGASLPIDLKKVGDNEQTLHVTIFYNDPSRGGLGVMQVYMYVDPNVSGSYSGWTRPYPLISFGMDSPGHPSNSGLGARVLEACVGQWPVQDAAFGFTASMSSCNAIFQVDNVSVTTANVDTTPGFCAPTKFVTLASGAPVTLTESPVAPDASGLSAPGWDVYTYPWVVNFSGWWDGVPIDYHLRENIIYFDQLGLGGPGTVTGSAAPYASSVPCLNLQDARDGSQGNLANKQAIPLIHYAYTNDFFGVLAKGYIYFPVAGTFDMTVASDDGTIVQIGNQVVLDNNTGTDSDHQWGSPNGGLNGGKSIALTVNTAGVYPIQVTYSDRWGGAYVEFYRRTGNPITPFVPYGASQTATANWWTMSTGPTVGGGFAQGTAGLADQPVIYACKSDGTRAPTNVSEVSAPSLPECTLTVPPLPEATYSNQGFNIKVVVGPGRWDNGFVSDIYGGIDENARPTGMKWFDALNGTASTSTVCLFDSGGYIDILGPRTQPSGQSLAAAYTGSTAGQTAACNMGIKATGYVYFPTAGPYVLGINQCGQGVLRIGGPADATHPLGTEQILATVGWSEPAPVFKLNVSTAGYYPIEVTMLRGASGTEYDQYKFAFYQIVAGHAWEPVNETASNSTVKVYRTKSGTPYAWPPESGVTVIPASARVGDTNTTGAVAGWNAKVVKSNLPDMWNIAMATATVENNLYQYGPGTGGGAVQTAVDFATPENLNYWDAYDVGSWASRFSISPRFFAGTGSTLRRTWESSFTAGTVITPGANNDQFVMSATGYILFNSAGYYAFNIMAEDAGIVWIGGKVVTIKDYANGSCTDSQPAVIYVGTPGKYDIRVDYLERGSNAAFSFFQYVPTTLTSGRTPPAILNDSTSPEAAHVYRTLATGETPLTTSYQDPTRLLTSTIVGAIDSGVDQGFNVQVAQATYGPLQGNGNGGYGHADLLTLDEAHELLAAVFDGIPSPNQTGVAVYDSINNRAANPPLQRIAFGPGSWDNFPGSPGNDFFAVRVTANLALKAGGHLFQTINDDGVRITLGGQTWQTGSAKGARWEDGFYVYVPQDGLYPLTMEYVELWGGLSLYLIEITDATLANYSANFLGWEFVNDYSQGTPVTRAYLKGCGTPFADADGDHDVDQDDFAVFQICFTGPPYAGMPALSTQCTCLDRSGAQSVPDSAIDGSDYLSFMNCWTGPSVIYVSNPACQ